MPPPDPDGRPVTGPLPDLGIDLVDALADAVLVINTDGVLQFANRAAAETLGWAAHAWVGRSVLPLIHPDDLNLALLSVTSVQDKAVGTPIELRVRHADGRHLLIELRGRSVIGPEGDQLIVLSVRDLTDRRRWELARGDTTVFQTLIQYAPAVTMLLDRQGRILSSNAALMRLLGHDPEQVEGQPLSRLAVDGPALDVSLVAAGRQAGVRRFEAEMRHADGSTVPFELHVVNLLDDPVASGLVVSAHPIVELAAARERLEHIASHDELTGLPNRALMLDRLNSSLSRTRRNGGHVAVVFCDLDGFKAVNDLLGHAGGDQLLHEVGARLRRHLRAHDTVARVGGDEFVLIIEDAAPDVVEQLVTRLADAVGEPYQLESGVARVSLSTGVAFSINATEPAEALLRRADDAMYQHKARRG